MIRVSGIHKRIVEAIKNDQPMSWLKNSFALFGKSFSGCFLSMTAAGMRYLNLPSGKRN